MTTLVAVWWLFFWTVLGLCLGSFLNAVIYRIPRHGSLHVPLWSACPHCRNRIAWYDNIPVVSFVILKGRCRMCGVPISTRYVIVEVVMALIVLMLLDAFLIGGVRSGLSVSQFGLTDRLAYDWPILAAHIILFACMLAMSAIDLEHYWIDIRFTNFVVIAGFVLHAIWTPKYATGWPRPDDATAVIGLLAVVGLATMWVLMATDNDPAPAGLDEEESHDAVEPAADGFKPRRPPPSLASPSRVGGWLAVNILATLVLSLLLQEVYNVPLRHLGRALLPLALFFGLILAESSIVRDSDKAIVDAIDSERHGARQMVLAELLVLLPAVALGLVGYWLTAGDGDIPKRISEGLHTEISVTGLATLRHWQPLWGLGTAAAGYIIAGALGWTVRIVFTLVLGKEAFGVGDIHLMAAAGCVAGWPVVVLGFFLTAVLALVGWIATLPLKRTRAIPLGPWLALSFLIIVIFYDSVMRWPPIERTIVIAEWFLSNNSQASQLGGLP